FENLVELLGVAGESIGDGIEGEVAAVDAGSLADEDFFEQGTGTGFERSEELLFARGLPAGGLGKDVRRDGGGDGAEIHGRLILASGRGRGLCGRAGGGRWQG